MACSPIRWLLALVVVTAISSRTAQAGIIPIEFVDADGPHWIGYVDTTADTLTITSWVENPGGIAYWTPAALHLIWPAVDADGSPFDVPDTFDGTIDATFAFISPVGLDQIAWNEGVSTETERPGWGGSGTFVGLDETRFQPIPISATQSVISTGEVTVPVPEPSSLVLMMLGGLAFGAVRARRHRLQRPE